VIAVTVYVFPDATAAAAAVLRDVLADLVPGVSVVTRFYDQDDPARPAYPFVVLRVDAAYGNWPRNRTVNIRAVAYDANAYKATAVSERVIAALGAYRAGPHIRNTSYLTGPLTTNDPETGEAIAASTHAARMRLQTL
jgi:hypothetical protein